MIIHDDDDDDDIIVGRIIPSRIRLSNLIVLSEATKWNTTDTYIKMKYYRYVNELEEMKYDGYVNQIDV